ncbi:MAG: DEAD/DEAH box helicase family protein [Sterolibacterium sp.]
MSLLFDDEPNYASACFPPPRPFQQTAHDALRAGVVAGHKNQMVMAPTGSGKTYLGLRIIHEALLKGKKAVFMCDRKTLINQTSEVADKYGLSAHGILQASHWRMNSEAPFQIASAQTVARRQWPDADVIVIDEAHTQLKTWTDHIPDCRAKVIGLSATPFSPGLGKLFTNLVNATTMHDLTLSGVLVPMRIMTCTMTDMRGAETKGGEWTENAAAERGMGIIGDVVSEWIKYAEHRKTIVFGATIKHCEEICRQFNEIGVMAAVFCADTLPTEREFLLKEYRKHDSTLRVLVSVEALAKGFDVPDVGCIVDCRPLRKSLSTAIQMWGRGLRSSQDTGKSNCILLDHSGNIQRFLEDYTDIFFNGLGALDSGEKLDKAIRRDDEDKEKKGCPACGYKPFYKRCMACGHEHKSQALVETLPGEMREIMMGKKKLADDSRHLYEQACTYARAHSAPEKQSARAYYLFRDMVGREPPKHWSINTTPDVQMTKNFLNKIRSKNIAYAKARERAAV